MKKALSFILALVMCLLLCACGKSEAVLKCEDKIESLGDITLDSIYDLNEIRRLYDSLSEEEKRHVSNYEKLTVAEKKYENLRNEFESQVEKLLAEKPSAEVLTALRNLPRYDIVAEAIALVSREILCTMIRNKGSYESGTYCWETGNYTFEIEEGRFIISKSRSKPYTSAKSSFNFSSGDEMLIFPDTGNAFYFGTDFFKYRDSNNRIAVVHVSWNTNIPCGMAKERFTENFGMNIGQLFSDSEPWPYADSKDSLNKRFEDHTVAVYMLDGITTFLKQQGLTFSAWELAGLYDSDML